MSLKNMSVPKEKNLYILNDAVVITTTDNLGIRVDFLVTGQTYFDYCEMETDLILKVIFGIIATV